MPRVCRSSLSAGALVLVAVVVLGLGGARSALGKPANATAGPDKPRHVPRVVLSVVAFKRQAGGSHSSTVRNDRRRSARVANSTRQVSSLSSFSQCPPDGQDTSCGVLVTVSDGGTTVATDSTQPPLDGIEDTLIGVQNSSSSTIGSLQLSSNTDLFGFDGDGLCTVSPRPSGCPFGSTGYEGPGTSFSNINPSSTGGVVNFTNGLAPGASAYFSLEEALTGAMIVTGGPSVSEQGGPPNPAEKPVTISAGCPVNCATGVFWHQWGDLHVPGRGVPLDFQRTYNSAAAGTDGPLGFGWTDSYNMSVSFDQSGDATVHQEDGSTVTFSPDGSGGYVAAPRVLARLVHNGDGTYTFTRNADFVHFNFSSAGLLMSEVDRNGYTTALAYNGTQLASATDPAGRTFSFAYSGSHIASVTGPGPRVESFTYDGAGNLQTATDPALGMWQFTYDANHRLLTMIDPRNDGSLVNHYNAAGQVDSQTDMLGTRTTNWSYSGDPVSPAGGTTTVTDPKGNVTTLNFANLELLSKTDATGTSFAATTSYVYDAATLGITQLTDPNNHSSTATYDTSGNQTSFEDALQRQTTATYNSFNEPLIVHDATGVDTTRSYDANGNLLSVSRPIDATTSEVVGYHYDDLAHPGDVTRITDPNGHDTTLTYDSQGDPAGIVDAMGDKTTFVYDALGQRSSMVSPRGNVSGADPNQFTTSYVYDALGRLKQTTDPLGHVTKQSYDADGNAVSSTDGDNNVTQYGYNADNELTQITRADGTLLKYGYDNNGNQDSQTDGANQPTTYGYDPLDRVSSVTDPRNRATQYGYDTGGNLTSLIDPSGRTTTYGYDSANELSSIGYSDGVTSNVGFTYTADGLRQTMVDGTGTTTYSYDEANRLTGQANPTSGQSVGYGYDLNGNLTALTYPNGHIVSRGYDNANRLTGITDWLGHTTSFAPDPDSNTSAISYANGITATSVFDNADQISSIADKNSGGTTVASFTYARDGNGQLTSTTPTGTGQGGNETYGYNSLNQLTGVNSSSYGYDAADNITGLANGATLGYDAANEATSFTAAGGSATALGYDSQGNRISGLNGVSYSYDQANRLVSATGSSGNLGLLAAGQYHSLAVKSDGTVWAWGYNFDGEVGDGTTTERHTPVQVSGITNATAVAAGFTHSLALTSSGSVESWGKNDDGQLGDGTNSTRLTPVAVNGLSSVVAIAAGNAHSLAVKSNGTVWAWGYNTAGELGDGTTTNRLTPVQVSGLTGVLQVDGGGMSGFPGHSAALKSDGTVWTWGYNKHGQLGLGNTTNQTTPHQVPGLTGVEQITVGGDNTYALKPDGTVWAWGDNSYKQLGNTSIHGQSTSPVQVNISGVASISAGATHVLALKTDGTAWGWGNDNSYELGDNGACGKTCVTPTQITGLGTNAALVEGGWIHSLAAMKDGTVKAWGGNSYGQLGDGTTTVRFTPVNTSALVGIQRISFTASYDGDGLRSTVTSGSTTLHFAWDLSGDLPLLLSDGSTSYLYDDTGTPVEQIDTNGTPLYYQHDQLDSTRLLTDQSGAVTATYVYDAYGNLTSHTGAADTPLRWNGQYQDSSTGLYYLRARYHDPQTGQFLSIDPLTNTTGQRYAYADADPLDLVDPLGLHKCGVLHPVGCAKNVGHWAVTPHRLPNPAFVTSFANISYGVIKVESGVVLLTVGTAADVTGVGAVLGVPAQAWGIYQLTTGGFRIYRGVRQANNALNEPIVCKTPVHYLEDTALNVAPFGGGLTNVLGGLP
jgi:RHS repeat-associated protein